MAVSPDRLQLAEKESEFLERVAVRVTEEKGVVFCGREEEKKRRQPKGVEKKRRQKEKGVDVAWCRREEEEKEEKEEDKARMDEKIRFQKGKDFQIEDNRYILKSQIVISQIGKK